MQENKRLLGRVCFYNTQKGYGFIRVPGQSSDYYVEHKNIKCDIEQFTRLQLVSFIPHTTTRGPIAIDVTIAEPKRRFGEVKQYDPATGRGLISGSNELDYAFHKDDTLFPEELLFRGRRVFFALKHAPKGLFACDVRIARLRLLDTGTIKEWVEMARNPRKKFSRFGWVYVFEGQNSLSAPEEALDYKKRNVYKIGYSNKPHRRRKEIQRKQGGHVSIAHKIGTNSPLELEQVLHRIF